MTLSTAFLIGLVGCNADNNEALDNRNNDTTQPIGYYTNDNMGDRNGTPQGGRYSRQDVNYHGQMNNTLDGRANQAYYKDYDGKTAESIARRVSEMNNVDDARCVITRDSVLVAVDTNDRNKKDVEDKVRAQVEQMAQGKTVRVVTDEGMYDRVTTIDNRLRDGEGMREVGSDLRGIMDDLGDAISRPFENNER